MPSQKLLVAFLDGTHHLILEVNGKWVEKEHVIQSDGDCGEDPRQLYNWHGIWDRKEQLPKTPGLYVWEGELDDIDNTDKKKLIFLGSWRRLVSGEWTRLYDYLPLWSDPMSPPAPAEEAKPA